VHWGTSLPVVTYPYCVGASPVYKTRAPTYPHTDGTNQPVQFGPIRTGSLLDVPGIDKRGQGGTNVRRGSYVGALDRVLVTGSGCCPSHAATARFRSSNRSGPPRRTAARS
jgi:hypothetical protein